jgi:hypothetical protein
LRNSSKVLFALVKKHCVQPSMPQAEEFSDQFLNHNYTVPSHKHLIEMSSPPFQLGEQFQLHHISDETFN